MAQHPIDPVQGGTGVNNNNASTITVSGNFGITLTLTATTSVTFPTSGTLITSATNITASQLPAFSGDATTSAGSSVLTLATVNGNVGSFGSASQVPVFTVNGKGLITAVTNTSIAIASGAVSGLAASATTDTTNASNISSGTLPSGRLTGVYSGVTGLGAQAQALNMNSNLINNVATPVSTTDAVNKAYVDAIAAGLSWKQPTKAATTANRSATYVGTPTFTLTNNSTQVAFATDGYSASVNDRILVKNQSTQSQNGIYVVTTVGSGASNWVLTRATDFDSLTPIDEINGAAVYVEQGTLYNNTGWTQIDTVTTFDTSNIAFAQFSGGGSGVSSLTGTANQISVDTPTGAVTLSLTNPINVNTTGSAATLTTPRTINGTSFDGSANITVTAAAGTLTGTTLNSSVVTSSLTSVGTVTSGTWSATTIAANKGGTGFSSYTIGDLLYADTTSTLAKLAIGTSGFFLKSNGAGVAPSWTAGAAVAGSDTQIQYNSSGAFGADAGFTWTVGTQTLNVGTTTTAPKMTANAGASNGLTFTITGSAATSGNGGGITVTTGAGSGSGGTSGTLTLAVGAPGAGTTTGGSIVITAGTSSGNAAGGNITLTGGTGVGTAAGGRLILVNGVNSSTGNVGAIFIGTGSQANGGAGDASQVWQTSGNIDTGMLIMTGAVATANQTTGGRVLLVGGCGGNGQTSRIGQDITISGGEASSAGTAVGGSVWISAGRGTTNSNGGVIAFGTSGNTTTPTTVTERFRILNNGAWSVGSAGTNTGTSGQLLTSNGSGSAPTWQTQALLSGIAATQIAYGSGTNTITSESEFTWDATNNVLTAGSSATPGIIQAPDNAGVGVILTVRGGAASGAGNAGGTLTLTGGTPADGNGGAISLTGRAGVGTSRTGGGVTITAGTSTNAVAGGGTTITAGTGGPTGNGGALILGAGNAGATSGVGGSTILRAGSAGGASLRGNLTIYAGGINSSDLSASNGQLLMHGAASTLNQLTGGTAFIYGGMETTVASSNGGDVNVNGGWGTASGTGTGGNVNIIGGRGGNGGGAAGFISFTTSGTTGVGAGTERFRILANGAWSVGSAGTNTGTSGQVLASTGATTAPAWSSTPTLTGTNITGVASIVCTASGANTNFTVPFMNTTAITTGTYTQLINSSANFTFNPSTNTCTAVVFNATSDRNLKTNIVRIGNALDIITSLNGVRFNWKNNNLPGAGLIAQDVEAVMPELVATREDGTKSMNYSGIVGALVEALKEMNATINALKAEIEQLKAN